MSNQKIRVINPTNGEELGSFELWPVERISAVVAAANETFHWYRRKSFEERSTLMIHLADLLENRKLELSQIMTDEMGKPVTQSVSEIEKCAWVCRYYAENAKSFLESESVEADPDKQKAVINYQPLGVILAVMPWNFPFWQVFRFAAPTLMAGNVGLLKHANNVPRCAAAIQQLITDAGFPDGAFTNVPTDHDGVSNMIENPLVRAVTVTGSIEAGRKIAEIAGANLKKTVLELGGSDPYLVFADADLDHAAEVCARSRLLNSGQSCIAAKRFIVANSVHDEFVSRLEKNLAGAVVGDPRNQRTTVGPMARHDLRDKLAEQVRRSIDLGAVCLLGGVPLSDPAFEAGAFHPVCLLTEVRPGMPAFDEELFGPVASVIRGEDEDHMFHLANATSFGLGAAIFTGDPDKAGRIARESIEAGCVAINQMVASDPRLPFGGIKSSGYGRELSRFGIREFVNIQSVTTHCQESVN